MKNLDIQDRKSLTNLTSTGITTLLFIFFSASLHAQCDGNIETWYKKKNWAGEHNIKPHKSINQAELARQYCLNPEWWNKAFEFIRSNNLENIKPGRYIIDEGNVIAFVSEAPARDMDSIQWETHENFNDLQYIIKGKVKMGVNSLNNSQYRIKVPYDPQKDVINYEVDNGQYYVANPGAYFIFSPKEIHRPAGQFKKQGSIKKLLIKVRVPQGK